MNTILLLCLALVLQPAWGEELSEFDAPSSKVDDALVVPADLKDGDQAILRIANRRLHIEIASTPQSRERGLMQRNVMCADCGMLFIFEKPDQYNFWMKDTPLPLSIAFIAADGVILNIKEMLPNTLDTHASQGNALFALEMNSGWFSKNGIAPSARVKSLKRAPKAQ